MRKLTLIFILIAISIITYSQDIPLKSNGNNQGNNNNGQGKLWEKDDGNIYNYPLNSYVGIGTDEPSVPLEVEGQITADSMRITGQLHIGSNSLVLGGSNAFAGNDYITSTNGIIGIGKNGIGGFWNIRLGIGTQTPQTKQHLWDRSMVDVFTTYTHGGSNSANTNGFQVGIAASNNAELKQKLNFDMLFYTNNAEYMRLTKSGWLGLGTSTPLTKQNLHDATATTVYSSFTNLNSDLGLYVGINALGNAEIRQNEDLPITMFTNNTERFRVTRNGTNTRVAIGNSAIPIPVSMLHIGNDLAGGVGGGARPWMNIGTFYYSATDNMYVGLRSESQTDDRHDAIINWGDNAFVATGADAGPDDLRFIFTGPWDSNSGDPANNQFGAEIARMTYRGTIPRMGITESQPMARLHITANNTSASTIDNGDPLLQLRLTRPGNIAQGTANCDFKTYVTGSTVIRPFTTPNDGTGDIGRNIGIGNDFSNTIQPQRKLEIHDNSNLAQIRLAYTQNIFTDIHTEAGGNLLINPTNSQTGFNLSTTDLPTEAIDVNGNARIRGLNTGTNKGIVTHEADGTLHTITFDPANPNSVLHANGSWAPVTGGGAVTAVNGCSVNGSGEVELGTNPLIHHTDIPMNDNNLMFTGQGAFNNIGIGLDFSMASQFQYNKLAVLQDNNNFANNTFGLSVFNKNTTSVSSVKTYGIYSYVDGNNSLDGSINIAGNFFAKNGRVSIAGHFEAPFYGDGYRNFAIYVPRNKGAVSINYSTPELTTSGYPLAVSGQAFNTVSSTWVIPSDARLKTNIQPFNDGLDIIKQINPISFEYNGLGSTEAGYHKIGVLAQDVASIMPYTIDTIMMQLDTNSTDQTAILGFNSDALAYLSINSMKELDTRVTDLENTGVTQASGWSGAGTGQMFATDVNDKIAIGETSSSDCKFNVRNTTEQFCANFYTDATNFPAGLISSGMRCQVGNSSGIGIGLEGVAYSNNPNAQNYGLRGEAAGTANQNTGLVGNAYGQSNLNIGISASAYGGNANWALQAYVPEGGVN
ncbi:MAG: hypothetical protein A2033_11120 [Bacteroidetes bacterium GWA2_31_9]|nr:MAG: hypothetical protein A2033_11120 [Bacteroidetes bacterium GWA2_31_9]